MSLFTPSSLLNGAQALVQALSRDVVAIYDKDGKQLFNQFLLGDRLPNPFLSGARPRRAEVLITSKLMEHPLETGAMIADHKVVNLIRIVIPMLVALPTGVDMVLGNTSVFNEIKQYYDNNVLLTVQTKSGVYKNMVIEEMPSLEAPEYFDTLQIELKLKEAPFVKPQFTVDTRQPQYANPKDSGVKPPIAAPTDTTLPTGGGGLALTPGQIQRLKEYAARANPQNPNNLVSGL